MVLHRPIGGMFSVIRLMGCCAFCSVVHLAGLQFGLLVVFVDDLFFLLAALAEDIWFFPMSVNAWHTKVGNLVVT